MDISHYTAIPLPEDMETTASSTDPTTDESNDSIIRTVYEGRRQWIRGFPKEARRCFIDVVAAGDLMIYGWTVFIAMYATMFMTISSCALVYFRDTREYSCAFYYYSCFVFGIALIQFLCIFFFENDLPIDVCTNTRCMLGVSVCITSFASIILLGLFAYSMDVYITSDDVDVYPHSFFILICCQMFHLFCFVVYNICLCKRW